jgi:DNA-binding PadR family transcriptional regulator
MENNFMFKHFGFHPREGEDFAGRGHHGRNHARFGGREHGPGRPFGRGFGGGRERMFDSGDLQLIILELLAAKPSYGYELIKAIEEKFAGGYAPSPGVVYPTLTLLEERGFAEVVSSEGNRKTYGVTEAGRAELEANAERLRQITGRMGDRGEAFRRERSPEIMRAFHNLGEALRSKMMRGSQMTPEQVAKIAEAIDGAARAIDAV